MSVSIRNKTAAILAIVGGLFILIGGGTGMVSFLNELSEIVKDMMGEPNQTVETIFMILIFIAALGGVAVMIGGFLFFRDYVRIGKILIFLGAGIGIVGLIIWFLSFVVQGEGLEFFSLITTTFLGIGIILSIAANFAAKT